MALATTIQQVKAVHPRLLSGESKDALMPNMDAAEYKYLVPITGLVLYEDINTKFNNDPIGLTGLSTGEKALRLKMLAVSVAGAYMDEMPRNTGKITDNGLRSANSNEMQRIFGWEYKEFKQGITDLYYDSMDVLIKYLFDNKADFSDWTDSDEYAKLNALLVKSAADFNEHFQLYQPMRTFWQMRHTIQDVQDNYHRIGMGDDLFDYFNTLAAPTTKEKEITRALKKAMAYLAVYRTCRVHAVRFSDTGFSIINNDADQKSTTASDSMNMLEMKMRAAEQDGLQQMERAKRLCSELRAAASGKGAGFDAAYDAGPLLTYESASLDDRNSGLDHGVRLS